MLSATPAPMFGFPVVSVARAIKITYGLQPAVVDEHAYVSVARAIKITYGLQPAVVDEHAYGTILLTKTTATRNGVALNYRSVRGLYFLAVVFVTTIMLLALLVTAEPTSNTGQCQKH